MSRIGKTPISLPKGVELTVSKSNVVTVKGPKGTLSEPIHADITVKLGNGEVVLERPETNQNRHRAMHGLYRALVNNMVIGVSKGYEKEMELIGVGYRASNAGQMLEIQVGYSHPIMFAIPSEVKLSTDTKKGAAPTIKLESIDKQLLGQVAAKIRAFRKPEPYKGKGIKFVGEDIRRKAGKSGGKGKK